MSLHETWAAAKKQAWKEFKEAQKNYLKELDKKIKEPTSLKSKSSAEKKALDLALGEVGLDQGESLDDYLKFADGFGKQLDAFQKAVENNAKLNAQYDFEGEHVVLHRSVRHRVAAGATRRRHAAERGIRAGIKGKEQA